MAHNDLDLGIISCPDPFIWMLDAILTDPNKKVTESWHTEYVLYTFGMRLAAINRRLSYPDGTMIRTADYSAGELNTGMILPPRYQRHDLIDRIIMHGTIQENPTDPLNPYL